MGFLAGIVSLFGIRRYGKAGILWKALTGMLIFLVMVALAVPALFKAREKARQRYEQQYGHPPP
jgi:Ca2+/H+ antiporter